MEQRQVVVIGGYYLFRTCSDCPEQYDVFRRGANPCAYIRVRHSNGSIALTDDHGELMYTFWRTAVLGDGRLEDCEREGFLIEAIHRIHMKLGPKC